MALPTRPVPPVTKTVTGVTPPVDIGSGDSSTVDWFAPREFTDQHLMSVSFTHC